MAPSAMVITLSQPLVREDNTTITEIHIPATLRLHHVMGLDWDDPLSSLTALLDRASGVPEAYSRQLCLIDMGRIMSAFTRLMRPLQEGIRESDDTIRGD